MGNLYLDKMEKRANKNIFLKKTHKMLVYYTVTWHNRGIRFID